MSGVKLEGILEGHTATVRSLAFSRDGSTLASAADDGTVRVWDVARASSKRVTPGHRGPLTLGLSRNGRFLATAGAHEPPRLWDMESGQTLSTLSRPGAGGVAFASLPDRDSLAIAMEQRVLLWDAPNGAIRPLALDSFSHDQRYYPEALAFSPDGSTLATGTMSMSWERGSLSSFESVRLWEVPSGRLKRTLPPTPPMGTLAFSPNGTMLAAGQGSQEGPHEVHVWDVNTGRSLATVSSDTLRSWVDAVAFSPDERVVAIGVADSRLERASVVLLDLNGTHSRRLFFGSPVRRLAMSVGGIRLATIGDPDDHAVRVWSGEY